MAHQKSPAPVWTVPLLLFLLGGAGILLGRSSECLSLTDSMPGAPTDQVCTTNVAPGAVIFAVICWLTAVFVWLAQRKR